jgi:hypothetical protein
MPLGEVEERWRRGGGEVEVVGDGPRVLLGGCCLEGVAWRAREGEDGQIFG